MSAEAFEKRLEAIVVNVEVADEAEQEGFVIGKIEDPLVVFDPLAAFYDDDAVDAGGNGLLLAAIRARCDIDGIIRIRPGGALWSEGVV